MRTWIKNGLGLTVTALGAVLLIRRRRAAGRREPA
jgi:hypothetical protein